MNVVDDELRTVLVVDHGVVTRSMRRAGWRGRSISIVISRSIPT